MFRDHEIVTANATGAKHSSAATTEDTVKQCGRYIEAYEEIVVVSWTLFQGGQAALATKGSSERQSIDPVRAIGRGQSLGSRHLCA